jgi:hypothetical protein
VIAALGAAATLLTLRWLPAVYAVFALVFCGIVLSSGSTVSIWRHVYLIFPLFLLAARAGRFSMFDRVYLTFGLVTTGLFVAVTASDSALVS